MVTQNHLLEDQRLFPRFGTGPLTDYRAQSSFDWRKLKLTFIDEECLKFQHDVYDFLQQNPVFAHPQGSLSMDAYRHLTVKRMFEFFRKNFYDINTFLVRHDLQRAVAEAMLSYDPSLFVKLSLGYGMFPSVLRSLGTERLSKYVDANMAGEIGGAFALTEMSHGTNTKQMRTTATYDLKSGDFIVHTPDFEAAKCWVGNLGKTCTHAIVYAQLITPDGIGHGLNAFLVPIRNPKTLQAIPGVIVGDLGEKIGLSAVDNGFVMFNRYHIPRENLLARTGDVTEDGQFVTPFKDKSKRLGASLGALSGGRVGICNIATVYLTKAISIAVRYSASRKQFGPDEKGPELPVLEYQSQQYRLFPHLAAVFALKSFCSWLAQEYHSTLMQSFMGDDVAHAGMEIHAISSAGKPVCSWASRNGIQECREACGGHGYLKVSQLGTLRNDNDANCTYEGENNVLIQQASNWLLNVRRKGYETFKTVSPLNTAAFLADFDTLIRTKFNWTTPDQVSDLNNILAVLNCICAFQLEKTGRRVESLAASKRTPFEIRNESQSLNATTLSIVYGERMVYVAFINKIAELSTTTDATSLRDEQRVLTALATFHGLQIVLRHLAILYEGEFIAGPRFSDLINEATLRLLPVLKQEAIALVDSIAPPDFILNSPLGMSDGNVYKHLQNAIMSAPDALQRPSWWKDVVHWNQAKL